VTKTTAEVDPIVETSHTRVVRLVGSGMRVLELGCATGKVAALLTARGCVVTGVETDPDAARQAEAHCARVVVADLDVDDLSSLERYGPFDVVVAADVLEHLKRPEKALAAAAGLLAPHGYLVTSIPNVAHGSVRLALLAGRFPYSDVGLIDTTHVRFYTRTSMTSMLAQAGFRVSYVEEQQLDPEQGEVLRDVDLESLPPEARGAVRDDHDSAVYQFVAVASPRTTDDGLLSALRTLADRVRSLESDLSKNEQAFSDELRRHRSELQQVVEAAHAHEAMAAGELQHAQHSLLAAQEDTLGARRAAVLHEAKVAAQGQRILALESHVQGLGAHEANRLLVETQLLAARRELEAIYSSKLWRVASLYRRFVGDSLAKR
jgi:2-polyprenyl-3-methyl-5-hydroxy-6-metoxy-1,4-benzoquinol methylase